MNSRVLVVALLGVVGWAPLSGHATESNSAALLTIKAQYQIHEKKPVLAFSIRNISSKSLSLLETNMPWGNRYSVVILAADRKTGDPLKVTHPIDDDFSSPKVELLPGKSVDGKVDLAWHIEGLEEKLKSRDMVLFWYYTASGANGESLGIYGGWIEIQKNPR